MWPHRAPAYIQRGLKKAQVMTRNPLYPLYYFASRSPAKAVVVTLALMLSSTSEGLGILGLLPMLQLVMKGDAFGNALGDSRINEFFNQMFSVFHVEVTLLSTLVFIVTLITIKSVTKLLAMYIVSESASEITADFRCRMIHAIMKARWPYFTSKPAGHVSTAINSQPEFASNCIVKECNFVADAVQILIYFVIAFYVSWWITLGAIALGVAGTLGLGFVFRSARKAGQDQTNYQKAMMAKVLDSFRIMKPVRAMAREEYFEPVIRNDIAQLKSSYTWLQFSPHLIEQSNEIIKVVSLAAGLFVLMNVWGGGIESLFLLAVLFVRVFQRMGFLQKNYILFLSQLPSFWYTLDSVEEAERARESWAGVESCAFNDAIEFRSVSYAHASRPIFKDASVRIGKNNFTLITGVSGIGKSTLVDLVCGLYDIDSGQICIDGRNLRDIDIVRWRGKIGYVPQDSIMLNDTIKNNITLYDDKIDDQAVWDVLKKVGAFDFVSRYAEGLSAPVGESGGQLSGGQKQRIAIARALIKNPDLLILDEATSGLDADTERAIFSELRALAGRYTILAITHNQSLKKYADEIYVIDNFTLYRPAAARQAAL